MGDLVACSAPERQLCVLSVRAAPPIPDLALSPGQYLIMTAIISGSVSGKYDGQYMLGKGPGAGYKDCV